MKQGKDRETSKEVQNHLFNELLPFWETHGVDEEYGGFLTYFDREGRPTGETKKTLICQTRMIYTYSSAHRANLGNGTYLKIAQQGVEFLKRHFWDTEHKGGFGLQKETNTYRQKQD
jgi:mannobiose 2-epimerase